ncbi:sulfatase, partial [Eubacteriales bacterium OttesenSCG-928-A19]|nr:sulfatase [Eubacteriales bacterium OttesenSCG-928-A19]
MKAIMVMFDSLNRSYLPPYALPGSEAIVAPNFERLAKHTARFTRSYVGSMPCMPARRELHTGRLNFLHRSWGPLEPYDDSMPELLTGAGVYTHMISDHQHYWEDGGCTYHHRYNTWEIVRGQEGDRWKASVRDPEIPEHLGMAWRQDAVNRTYITNEAQQPQTQVFDLGMEFLEKNHDADSWFLHLETFDPHEPFYSMERYKALYPHKYDGPPFDWPPYAPVTEGEEAIEHMRCQYAAMVSMCDQNLGRVLDFMDENDMWKDTLLIVNTDHGYMLGEHDWWAKMCQPLYEEISHTPLFIWDPRCGVRDEARDALVQTIDIAPTLLDFFGEQPTPDMLGRPLRDTIANDAPVREALLFGQHGGQVCVTDGRYVYLRANTTEDNTPLYEYTHMPTHMRARFSVEEMRTMQIAPPFSFTKGCPLMRIDSKGFVTRDQIAERLASALNAAFLREKFSEVTQTLLFDLQEDPGELQPLQDEAIEARMIGLMVKLMRENDAPAEQYVRLGLERA